MKPELLDTALGRLDSADRALLELSLRRGVKDPELAELMRIDEEQVRRRRDAALEDLGDDLGIDERERLLGALLDHWRAPGERPTRAEPVGEAEAEPSSRRSTIVVIVIVALLGIGTGTLLAVLTNDSDDQQPGPPELGPPVAMEASAAARGGSGVARTSRERLVIRFDGLPRGNYQVWLYDSARRAQPVAAFRQDTNRLDVALPVDPTAYRFLDVSREPSDGNPDHSGASVLRAPIERLVEN